jgi:hypothetical protein
MVEASLTPKTPTALELPSLQVYITFNQLAKGENNLGYHIRVWG